MKKNNRSLAHRAFNSLFGLTFLVAVIWLLFAGVETVALGLLVASIAGVGLPVITGDASGIVEVFIGILEALLDGVLAILELIGSLVSSVFG